jgi:hypothetical protein
MRKKCGKNPRSMIYWYIAIAVNVPECRVRTMAFNPKNPLIIQSDKTVLLEVDNDRYEEARDALARFAECAATQTASCCSFPTTHS